jgi:hypothetical protein
MTDIATPRPRTTNGLPSALVVPLPKGAPVIVTPAEAANQVSYAEGNGGSRVWALLYGCAKEILSPAGGTLLWAMAVSFLSVAFSSSRFC